jgi:LmbE family N-acetylglucosaminyl deacetylase
MLKPFLGSKLLVVTAHPDDESYLAAGTILANRREGGSAFIVCATLGEKGKSHLPIGVTERRLKAIRARELAMVSKFLRVDGLRALDIPDGKLAEPPNRARLAGALKALSYKPDIVIGFGKDGITGHLDHIAAGEVAHAFAVGAGLPYAAFCAPLKLQAATRQLMRRRKHGVYCERLRYRRPAISIPIDPVSKMRALAFHQSQHKDGDPFSTFSASVAREILSLECFAEY